MLFSDCKCETSLPVITWVKKNLMQKDLIPKGLNAIEFKE
jgi:hypothetical protein